jgi:hypothetical protein
VGDTPNNGLVEAGAGVGLAPEPLPTQNRRPAIQDFVIADVRSFLVGKNVERIVKDLADRKEFGIRKYGTPLQAFNGRRPIVDAYQEVLDAANYLKQAYVEAKERGLAYKDIEYEYHTVLSVLGSLASMLPPDDA